MKSTRKLFIIMLIALIIILAACRNSPADSTSDLNNQSSDETSTQDLKEDSSSNNSNNEDENDDSSSADTETSQTDEQEETAASTNVEDSSNPSSEVPESKKEKYVQKLKETKKLAEGLEPTDSSTYALKKVENERWEIWDALLNEIYGVLEEQLEPQEMEQLREEQRNWIKYRDETALKASEKFKGGTQEHLEYVAVLANVTEERCYELVEKYMK
jgi:uncharacterized protein YecT (DUF1311 family)